MAVLAGAALAIAGCGSSSSSTVAHVGSSPAADPTPAANSAAPSSASTQNSAQLVRYVQCMRAHGVPNFPDPVDGKIRLQARVQNGKPVAGGVDPNSPAFQTAERDCKSLQPAGLGASGSSNAQMEAQALKWVACLRSHGVPNFPDPTFQGGEMKLTLSPSSGINPNSPAFQKAQQDCQSLAPQGGLP